MVELTNKERMDSSWIDSAIRWLLSNVLHQYQQAALYLIS